MLLLVFFICFITSLLGGLCGIGGGMISKPLLDATGIMSVSAVSFLSGVTVLAMALISLYQKRKTKELDQKRSLPLALGAACGGIIGKQLFEYAKQATGAEQLVGLLQSVLLVVLVLATVLYLYNKTKIHTKNIHHQGIALLIGLFLGICSSFLGIGGGPMNLVVLYYFFSMETKQAASNSLLIILLSQTMHLLVSLREGTIPQFEMITLLTMIGAGAIGGFFAAKLQKKLSPQTIDRVFLGLLLLILLICGYNISQIF